ncbi:MAG: response regulator [Planctomycetota bacterium]|nr:MAG: response regulator [Planctomycetota bacterium]
MISSAKRSRMLIVDDDPGILRAVSRIFAAQYDVKCADGPTAALELVSKERPPEVAVLDIRMPEMNGFELMRRLREVVPDLDVILMTGNAEEPDANLVEAIDAGAFYFIQKPFERRVLLALVTRCFELRRLRLEMQKHTRRLERELEEARQFQMSLLPPPEAQFGGLSISARYSACTELAGDFYDYAEMGDGTAALLIADVVGHGVSAAMMTGIVKAAFHTARSRAFDPLDVVNRVREAVRPLDAGRFVTLCCARVDLQQRELTYVNAGHEPMILHHRAGGVELLNSTGPLISSALVDIPCEQEVVPLVDQDFLLFYTDGVADVVGPEGRFGRNRLETLLASADRGSPQQTLDSILHAVSEFAGGREVKDDITLLGAELK